MQPGPRSLPALNLELRASSLPTASHRPDSCQCLCQDNVHVSFESIVDLSKFTVRVPEADAEKLPDILLAIPAERREEMQRALGRLWQK